MFISQKILYRLRVHKGIKNTNLEIRNNPLPFLSGCPSRILLRHVLELVYMPSLKEGRKDKSEYILILDSLIIIKDW